MLIKVDWNSKKSLKEAVAPKLNDNFWKWFGKSVCRDKNGNPIVFYHGTPNADLPELRGGTYFTQNKDYADGYQDQFASMLTRKKEARKPGTYAVYLKIENPFDTRKKKCRDEFYKYYYQQYGGTDLQESGLPDWTDGRDLLEFLMEDHPELGYDGLLLDEGGNYDIHGGLVYRGISYLPLSSNQIKSVDNNGNWSTTSNNIYESITPKLNDNFWNWFNGSKIVDKKGNPLVCYHETNVDFDTFDISKQSHAANLGYGFYFSSEPFWSKLNVDTKYKKECYLKIKNPFNATKRYTIEEVKFLFDDEVYNDIIKNSDIKGKYTLYNLFSDTVCYLAFESEKYSKTDDKEWYKMFYNNFQKAGYDGIKRYNSDYGMYEYVVFNPNQIKSIHNKGNWSSASNNINEWWSGGVNWQNDRKGLGGVGATQDCHLFFFMFPDQFLNLCPKFSYGDEKFFNQYVDSRKPLGIPFLWCEVDEKNKTLKVLDHEGRHRVQAIRDYALSKGKSQPDIPVAIVYNKDKYSLPVDLTELRKEWKIVSQKGDRTYNVGQFRVQNNLDNARIGLDNLYESIELNNNFWKWFGNSKTIKDGQPMVFYHGTPNAFTTFDISKTSPYGTVGQGFYFTDSKQTAENYIGGILDRKTPNSHVKSCYLRIENPYNLSDMITDEEISSLAQFIKTNNDDFWYKKILDDASGDYDETNYPKGFMFEEGYLVDPKSFNRKMLQNAIDWLCIEGALDNHNLNRDNVWFIMTDGFNTNSSKRALQRWLKQNGYDAVIYQIEGDNKGNGNYQNNCYVVFNPNQIKSVDNKGLYGLDNDDINEVLEEGINNNYLYEAGYKGYSKSNNAVAAEDEGKYPASIAAKKLGVSIEAIKTYIPTFEWHHYSSYYNEVYVYDITPYLMLKNNEDMTDYYDDEEITKYKENYEKMKQMSRLKQNSDEKKYRANVEYIVWTGTRNHPKANIQKYENIWVKEKGEFYTFILPDKTEVRKKKGSNGTYVIPYETVKARQKAEKEQEKIYKMRYKEFKNNTSRNALKFIYNNTLESNSSGTNFYKSGRKPDSWAYQQLDKWFIKGELRLSSNNPNQLSTAGAHLEEWDGQKWIPIENFNTSDNGEEISMFYINKFLKK